jgi:hypothetical protein
MDVRAMMGTAMGPAVLDRSGLLLRDVLYLFA